MGACEDGSLSCSAFKMKSSKYCEAGKQCFTKSRLRNNTQVLGVVGNYSLRIFVNKFTDIPELEIVEKKLHR